MSQPGFAPPSGQPAASVLAEPAGPSLPLNQLAPEAALRLLELAIVRKLEGFLHGDHMGLLPGPGSDINDARPYQPGQDLSLIHISEPTRLLSISYAVFCL